MSAFFDSFVETPELFYYGVEPAKDTAPVYVLCVKNKQVMALPNISERTYGDFDGLSDEEIIAMLQEDVGATFKYNWEGYFNIDLPWGDYLKYRDFAYNISTDDTGNSVESEMVVIPLPYSLVSYEINLDAEGKYNHGKNFGLIYACMAPHSYGEGDLRLKLDDYTIYSALYKDQREPREYFSSFDSSSLGNWCAFGIEFSNSDYSLGIDCPSRTVYNTQWYQITDNLYSRSNYSDIANGICVDYSDTEIDRSNDRINIDTMEWGEVTPQTKGVEMWSGITKEEAISLLENACKFDVERRLVDDHFYYYLNGEVLGEA